MFKVIFFQYFPTSPRTFSLEELEHRSEELLRCLWLGMMRCCCYLLATSFCLGAFTACRYKVSLNSTETQVISCICLSESFPCRLVA